MTQKELKGGCIACGSSLPAGARFCPSCGVSQIVQCSSCGTELQLKARFCHACGSPAPQNDGEGVTPNHSSVRDRGKASNARPGDTEARKHITVLFADIVGSTRLVEGLDPEDAKGFLKRSIEGLSPCIEAAGGVVAKIMGDGIFCVFGAPLAQEDHAYRACHAALDILAVADQLKTPAGGSLQLRVGLSSGTAVVNVTEGDGAFKIDAIGDVVNVAAHLEAKATPGTVLINESTRFLAGHSIEVRPVSDLNAFQLVSVGSNPQDLLPEDALAQFPFIGRNREMNFLMGAYEQLADGIGDVISVLGGAGVGKTRLLLEFSRQLQPTNARIAVASNRAQDHSDPNALLRRLVMSLLNIAQDVSHDPAQELSQKLALLDQKIAKHADDVIWLLMSESEEVDQKETENRRFAALSALQLMLETLADQGPLIILIDSFQWSDASSRTFLKAASGIVDKKPLLVLVFSREDISDFRSTARQVLQVRPLEHRAALQLLNAHFVDRPLSKDLLEKIITRAEGNPRFLTEFARHLAERGKDEPDSQTIQLSIPESVVDLFEERIDRLPNEAKQLLQAGAAFENPVTLETLLALTGQNEADTLNLLQQVIDAGLVRETSFLPSTLYAFVNPIVGEAAYRSLLRDERRTLHTTIYEYLRDAARGPGQDAKIGRQAFRAGLYEQAARSYFSAGKRAASRLAYTESTELLCLALQSESHVKERSLEIDQLAIDIRLMLRDALFATSQFDEIGKRLNEAMAICDRIHDDARSRLVQRHMIGNMVAQGNMGDALVQVRALIVENEKLAALREVAELRFLQSQMLAATGQYAEAFESSRAVMDACVKYRGSRHELSPITYALARLWLVWCAAELGRFEEVKFEVLDCQNDLSQDRPPFFRILAGVATGVFWLRFGNSELAANTLQSVLPLTKDDENTAWFHSVASPLGLALIRLDQAKAALPLLQEAVAREASGKGSGGRGTQAVHLASCWAALGNLRKAEDQARVAVSRARQNGDNGMLAYALCALGRTLSRNGQQGAAEQSFQEAMELAKSCEMLPLLKEIRSDMRSG
ncbi:adenylate/guanylate cyclase domain-containing protein [Aestuariivita boseongensis]|uniref:adenylate/guanylate cyclase domain-containing protein n=1 Tax=Aestuariivita boseongensis TaxID=1470562 RepID=UPI0009E4DEA1|nr:adenylate/guanylate cyclase domain-containing protein [Aestuariivita boseongensis]